MENEKDLVQITRTDEFGTEWLINVCAAIDNQQALVNALEHNDKPYKLLDGNLFANVDDCVEVDSYAAMEWDDEIMFDSMEYDEEIYDEIEA